MLVMPSLSYLGRRAAQAANIEYVGGKTARRDGVTTELLVSLTDLTGGADSAPQEDDFVIVSACVPTLSGGNMNMANFIQGYDPVADLYQDDSTATNFCVHRKFMGAVPDTNFNVSGTGWDQRSTAIAVHVWRNVNKTTPLDVAAVTSVAGNTGIPNPPAINPMTPGAVIIAAGGSRWTVGVFGTTDLDNFRAEWANSTYDAVVGMGSKAWDGLGPFDPAAFTNCSATSTVAACAVTLALRPA